MWSSGVDFLFLALIFAVVGLTMGIGTLCENMQRRKTGK
jgi:hypothetical protein